MEYRELVKAFAEKLGEGASVSPDADGMVMLDVGGVPLMIMGIEEAGQVALYGIVAEPPPEERVERLYRMLLEANYDYSRTFGATLSINPESGNVSLRKILPLALADADGFFSEVARFVNAIEKWRGVVRDFRGAMIGADDASEANSEGGASPSFGNSGFMQV